MGLVDIDVGKVIDSVASVADDLFTSDEEKLKLAIEDKQIDADLKKGQMVVNSEEAKHKSIFVAGWRPAIGWVCCLSFLYKFIIYNIIVWTWTTLQAFDIIPTDFNSTIPVVNIEELYPILLGMLGLGGLRTYEGIKGVKSTSMKN